MTAVAGLLFFFACSVAGAAGQGTIPLSSWQSGIATFYGGAPDGMNPEDPSYGTVDGSCGYGLLQKSQTNNWSVGALSTSSAYYINGPTQGCGECFEIQCVNTGGQFAGRCTVGAGSIVVTITDCCPECESDHIDLQALTFNEIAPMANGRIDIQYRRVECTPAGGIIVDVNENYGNGAWLRLTLQNTAGAGNVAAVQMMGANSGWEAMRNTYGAAWEIDAAPAAPLSLLVTLSDGSAQTLTNVVPSNGATGDFQSQAQFPVTGSGGCVCSDVAPNTMYTCAQQKAWGKCGRSWMTATSPAAPQGYCELTCGRCNC